MSLDLDTRSIRTEGYGPLHACVSIPVCAMCCTAFRTWRQPDPYPCATLRRRGRGPAQAWRWAKHTGRRTNAQSPGPRTQPRSPGRGVCMRVRVGAGTDKRTYTRTHAHARSRTHAAHTHGTRTCTRHLRASGTIVGGRSCRKRGYPGAGVLFLAKKQAISTVKRDHFTVKTNET